MQKFSAEGIPLPRPHPTPLGTQAQCDTPLPKKILVTASSQIVDAKDVTPGAVLFFWHGR